MKKFQEKIKNETKNIRLSDVEKRLMRATLATHVLSFHVFPISSPYAQFFAPRAFVPILAALVLLVGSGTAYAAQHALPGSPLYPIKIHINEAIEVALATTPQARADVETQIAERRVEEAQTLTTRGELDATTTQELQNNFDKHASRAEALATEVRESNSAQNEDLSIKISASLTARGDALADTVKKEQDKKKSENAKNFADHVRAKAEELLNLRRR